MINIVIPMAGKGSRFLNQGYTSPKPLIEVNKKFMIEGVVDNLTPTVDHRFIFICQKSHLDNYGLAKKLKNKSPGCVIIPISEYTNGAACTVLLAQKYIDNDSPLMIANSDQWIDLDINNYLNSMTSDLDGIIMTMTSDNPKWSFVKFDSNNKVVKVVEKEVVSNEATVGLYNFKSGRDFCYAANKMIEQKKKVNGEYYVAPVYNELIDLGQKISVYNIESIGGKMYGLGIPEDLELFIMSDKSRFF